MPQMGIRKSSGQRYQVTVKGVEQEEEWIKTRYLWLEFLLSKVLWSLFFPSPFPKLNTVLFVVNTKLTLVASFQDLIQHRTAYSRAAQETLTKHGELCSSFSRCNAHCQLLHSIGYSPTEWPITVQKYLPILIGHYKYDSDSSLKSCHAVKKYILK